MSKVFRTKSLFTPSFLSMEYIEIVLDIDDDYDDDNSLAKSVLSLLCGAGPRNTSWVMWETTQKLRKTARNLSCVLERTSPALQAFENKDFAVQAWPGATLAAARSGTSLTHQCFVNNYTRSLQRESVNAQILLSNISDNISHQDWCSEWMMDEWVSSGNIFSKLNLTKFDKIKFQKSWHQTLMLTKSWWERPINSWKTRYFSFFFTPKDAWQRFCLIETWKFLEFTQGSLQERSSPLLSPYPASDLKQACSSECNEGTYFDKTAL